jgi:hypothetical protein
LRAPVARPRGALQSFKRSSARRKIGTPLLV